MSNGNQTRVMALGLFVAFAVMAGVPASTQARTGGEPS